MYIHTCIYIITYYNIILLKRKLKQYKKISHQTNFPSNSHHLTAKDPSSPELNKNTCVWHKLWSSTLDCCSHITHFYHTNAPPGALTTLPLLLQTFLQTREQVQMNPSSVLLHVREVLHIIRIIMTVDVLYCFNSFTTQIFVSPYSPTHPLDGSDTACVHQTSRVRQWNKQKTSNLSSGGCTVPCRQGQTHTGYSWRKNSAGIPYRTGMQRHPAAQAKPVPGISLQLTQWNTCSWQHPLIWNETEEVTFQGWQIKSWSVIRGTNKYSQWEAQLCWQSCLSHPPFQLVTFGGYFLWSLLPPPLLSLQNYWKIQVQIPCSEQASSSFSFAIWPPLSFHPLPTKMFPTSKAAGNWFYFPSPTASTHCVKWMICIHRFLSNNHP